MRQLPHAPTPNERALGQTYHESFTGLTGTTVTLASPIAATVNGVPLLTVYKNGLALDGGGLLRESFTGLTGTAITLTRQPAIGSVLLFKNGHIVDPTNGLPGATEERERLTGLTTTSLTLATAPLPTGTEIIWKNGSLLDPNGGAGGYTIAGASVTLGAAAVAADVFVARYRGVALTYTVAAKVITLSIAAIADDVWTVWYLCNGIDAAGYTVSANTVTLATALVVSDRLDIAYSYRT